MLSLTLVGEGERGAGIRASVQVPADQARFTIGRDPVCDWVLTDRSLAVSARHCEIVRTPSAVLLHDHSTNGTFVNGAAARMKDQHRLRDGDRIEVGPFTIEVRLAAEVAGGTAFAATAPLGPPKAASPGSSAVNETGPLPVPAVRGRDPAAAAASLLPPEDVDLTRIRPAPPVPPRPPAAPRALPPTGRSPAAGAPTPPAASPPAMPVAAPAAASDARSVPPDDDALRAQLAQALGVPPQVLAGRDPAQLLVQMGALTRVAVDGLRRLLAAQADTQREIGSRRPADWRAGTPLRLTGSTEEALLALLGSDGEAPMALAFESLIAHQARLVAAPRTALRRLGEDLSPPHLAAALPTADPARQWALYARLWQRLGLAADDAAWADGLVAAGWLHLAAAYDQDPPA